MGSTIPMFPLTILPLPGELVPLHIFEPRYRELLDDAEAEDIKFGIYFNHAINTQRVGSLMKLERIIKKYETGESDIIVKCYDAFTMDKMYRSYRSKQYSAGDVNFWKTNQHEPISEKLDALFREYLLKRNIVRPESFFNAYAVAIELNLDVNDRYDFMLTEGKAQESFLIQRIRYQLHLFAQEERSKDVFHLN
ncbi:MAG TPA: hypothetical protein PKL56_20010 [Cyclobacteriaceae bacterium]|nr:hypothetical protein [Cyclobacteriaceae bacterium]HMV09208.1 hypothetical protein [Cyclobacteriaceae bacterium]HMX01423.1 hypothetical protein [Cyclobacteriaceae bacterium]HMY92375.1 hypothetical protein [Cyclobacteriaceae bacterium]HNA11579.1 hypothetical protein [Cyclobacteriaceae bacterium]